MRNISKKKKKGDSSPTLLLSSVFFCPSFQLYQSSSLYVLVFSSTLLCCLLCPCRPSLVPILFLPSSHKVTYSHQRRKTMQNVDIKSGRMFKLWCLKYHFERLVFFISTLSSAYKRTAQRRQKLIDLYYPISWICNSEVSSRCREKSDERHRKETDVEKRQCLFF